MSADQWVVILDDEIDSWYRTRAKARDYASWLRHHPAVVDRKIFYKMGRVRVLRRSEWEEEECREEMYDNDWECYEEYS